MTFPFTISIGDFSLSVHFLMETLAYILGYRLYVFLRSRQTDLIPDENRLWILIGAAAGAFLGSRLVGVLEDPAAVGAAPYLIIAIFQSKTIVGGLLGGLFGVEIIKKLIGERHSSGDLFTYPLILAMMIGRIGCFSSGVFEPTYGIETDLPWAMNLGDGLQRHPVALYEILFLGCLWGILYWGQHRWRWNSGIIFQLFMIAYLIFRIGLEYIKPHQELWMQFSGIQLFCMLGLLYYSKTIFSLFVSPKSLQQHDH